MADVIFKKPITPTPEPKTTAEILSESLKTVPEVAKAAPDAAATETPKATPKADKSQEVVASAVEGEIDIETLTEEEALRLDSIIARPLGYGNALDIKVKRNEYAYRWVNKQEQRQATMRALGFQPADLNDVDTPFPDSYRDGVIQMGDVILMKMRKATYFAALKNNMKKAIIMGNKEGLDKAGLSEGHKAVASVTNSRNADKISQLVSTYVPPIGELGK